MSDKQLTPPFLLREHKELVEVCIRHDDVCLKSQQLITPILVPEKYAKSQVTLQCIDDGRKVCGPVYVYDWAREEFVEYNEATHKVPKTRKPKKDAPKKDMKEVAKKVVDDLKKEIKSITPVAVEKSPLDLSGSSKVELSSDVHAQDPPSDEKDEV